MANERLTSAPLVNVSQLAALDFIAVIWSTCLFEKYGRTGPYVLSMLVAGASALSLNALQTRKRARYRATLSLLNFETDLSRCLDTNFHSGR